jgi:glycosyltransferase involved in cell wall biosynthesis
MPKVSVVVPNYNHARFLRQRIDSILRQTFRDFELILLDDCSTDESQSILHEYASEPCVRMDFNKVNSGSTFKQWNRGVRLARGKYIWIAESDDYADEDLLEKLASRLDGDPDAVLCYCRSWRVSGEGRVVDFLDHYLTDLDPQRWTADFWADGREECREFLINRNTILSASSVLFRKDVYQRVGGADERLVLCGDWKTWASMALTGGRIAYFGEPLNYYRFHQRSVTVTTQRLGIDVAESLQVIRWILQRVAPTETTRTRLCHDLFPRWHPTVLTNRIPIGRRLAILRDARAIDRKAIRKLIRPALVALRMTLARRYRSLRGGARAW